MRDRVPASLVARLAAAALLLLAGYAACRLFVFPDAVDPSKPWARRNLALSTPSICTAVVFGLLLVAGAMACAKVLRKDWFVLLAPLAIVVGTGHAGALAGLVVQAVAGLAVGIPLYRRLRSPDAPGDTSLTGLIVSWFLGGSVNAYIAWIALHWRINYDYVYFGFLLAEILLLRRSLAESLSAIAEKAKSHRFSPGQWAIALCAVLLLPCALVPLYIFDDVTRHLFFPKQIAMFGKHAFDPGYIWAVDTEVFAQSHFAISYLLGGEYAVRLSNYAAAFAALLLVESYCRRAFGPHTALWTALVMVSTPLLGTAVSAVYLETFNLLSVAVPTVVVLDVLRRIDRNSVLLFFFLATIAYLYKQQAVFLTVPLAAIVAAAALVRCVKERSYRPMIWLAAGCLLAAVIVAPFFVQNYVLTGNPCFPWLNGVFRSAYFQPGNFEGVRFDYELGLRSITGLTFHGELFGEDGRFQFGISYFVLACFVPFVLVGRKNLLLKWTIAGLFAASVLLWWRITSPNIRYFAGPLVPGSMLLGLTMNTLWERMRNDRLAAILAKTALAVALGVNAACQFGVTEHFRPYPLLTAFTKRFDQAGGRVATVEEIKRVFDAARVKYGKQAPCLVVWSEFLYLVDQPVEWLHGLHFRNWQSFGRCKDEEEAFDWIFRERKCACMIMAEDGRIPLLASPRFREKLDVELSTVGYLLLAPKADTVK